MKAKLIRKRLFAGIICLGLTGNLFLYNVSAAEAGQASSTAKAHWKISPAAVERRRTDRSRYLQQVSGIQPLRMKTGNRLLRMTPASRISPVKQTNRANRTIPVSRRTQVNRTIPVSRIKTSRGRSRQQYPFPEKR